jgi:hypothetical protein
MTEALGWREQIMALPDVAFPVKNEAGTKTEFEDRDDMLAGFEWFETGGRGKAFEEFAARVATKGVLGLVNAIAHQWKSRKVELAKMAKARDTRLAPLAAKREEQQKQRAEARARTIVLLAEDLKETADAILATLDPGFGEIDWEAAAPHIGHLSSLYTRLRFQQQSARKNALKREAA